MHIMHTGAPYMHRASRGFVLVLLDAITYYVPIYLHMIQRHGPKRSEDMWSSRSESDLIYLRFVAAD